MKQTALFNTFRFWAISVNFIFSNFLNNEKSSPVLVFTGMPVLDFNV